MTDLSILIPVLKRPANAAPQVHNILEATSVDDCDFEIMFIVSAGDQAEIDAVRALDNSYSMVRQLRLPPQNVGDYAKKINLAFANTDSTWLLTGADDLNFHEGWWGAILSAYTATGRRVIGTQDLGNKRVLRGDHSTHSVVHRSYVEEFGTIDEDDKMLHEGYPHEFVDDEFIETAKSRDEFVFAGKAVIEHLHPLWGKAESDPLYRDHRRRMVLGRRLYEKRKRKWKYR